MYTITAFIIITYTIYHNLNQASYNPTYLPRGSIYTTVMELRFEEIFLILQFQGPKSIVVVYVEPLG